MSLTEPLSIIMNNSSKNKDLNVLKLENFNWNIIQLEMKNKLGKDIYESWLKKIEFVEEFNNYLLLSVPTRFIRDWITSRYLDQILQTVKKYKKGIVRLELKIGENNTTKKDERNLVLLCGGNFDKNIILSILN